MKNLISLALVMLVITNLYTQQQQANDNKRLSPEQRIENRLNKFNEITGGLSDEQKEKIKAILEDNHKQAKAIRQKFAGDKEKMHEAQKKLRANFDTHLKEILSQEQYEKVIAYRKEMRQKHQQQNNGSKSETTPLDDSRDEIYD